MAAASFAIPYDPPDRKGFDKLRRGAAEDGMPPGDPLWNWERLCGRLGPSLYTVWQWFVSRTSGPYGPRRVPIDFIALKQLIQVTTDKSILSACRELENLRLLSSDPNQPLVYGAEFEHVNSVPQVAKFVAPGRGRKPMGHADVIARSDQAACEVREATTGAVVDSQASDVRPLEPPPLVAAEVTESTPGNIFPEPDAAVTPEPDAGDEQTRPCPVCHGTGRVPAREIYFPPGEIHFAPAETQFREILASATNQMPGDRPKKVLEVVKKQAVLASDPTEGQLDQWISRQPWGRIDNLRRRGLTDAEARPVIDRIHAGDKRVEHFVSYLRAERITISPDPGGRINITGLLIRLVDKMLAFARPYSADRPSDNRSCGPPGDPIE
jgi:hypothetical protein